MESKRKILVRYRRGDGIRAISRELNISRNTVRDIIRSKGNIKSDYVRVIQPTPKLGEYTEKLEKMLRDNKHSKPNRVESLLTETPSHTTVQAMSHTAVLLLCLPKANERLKSPNLLNHSRFIALCTI